jgi:hypothetical protein
VGRRVVESRRGGPARLTRKGRQLRPKNALEIDWRHSFRAEWLDFNGHTIEIIFWNLVEKPLTYVTFRKRMRAPFWRRRFLSPRPTSKREETNGLSPLVKAIL